MNSRYDPYYPTSYRREDIPDTPRPPQKKPPVAVPSKARPKEVMTVGNWFGAIFLMAIPLVGLIALFCWAFGKNTKPSRRNFARASLLWMLIGIVLVVGVVLLSMFVFHVNFGELIETITGNFA